MRHKKFDDLIGKYQSNLYPAMADYLAHILGVSAESLRRLGVGFAPIVQFKNSTSYDGWWAIPERDETADVVGIALRSQNNRDKVMMPASDRGFVYEVHPQHSQGQKGYEAGPHNWVRTMDAGIICPVCGKPDGCLLSSENPADPKAVICIRQKSPKELRFGYLHLLKSEAKITGVSALNNNGGPVLVVEGMSDAAAALDLGYDAVGRPSNLAKLDMLANIVRGRKVIVIGENDRKPDGREPGKEGMIAAFQACRKSCKDVTMLMPPEHAKDLRAWLTVFHLNRMEFEAYLDKHGTQYHENNTLENPYPLTVARAWLHTEHRIAGRTALRNFRGQWYQYHNGRYVGVEEDGLRSELYRWSENKLALHETAKGQLPKPLALSATSVSGVLDAALADSHVEAREIPSWINNKEGPRPEDLIVFANGILSIPAYLNGEEALTPLTPDYFTRFAAEYPFDPTAQCPLWLKFLGEVFADDEAKVDLLQEWFGYCFVPDTSLHKMLLMVGPPRSGKSTIINLLRHMLGPDQCAATTFRQLTTQFGLAPMIGCLAAVMGDAHLSARQDGMAALEVLKQVVAGDPQGIDIKYDTARPSIRLKTRFTIAVNELPELPDFSGAMIPRLNILDFKYSFTGREDFGLEDKLKEEIAGIALWAMAGLARLRQNGRFAIPQSGLTILEEWSTLASPIRGFIEEATQRDGEITKDELFDAYEKWREERRIAPMSRSRFLERVKSAAPHAISDTYEQRGHKFSVFKGIELKDWARRKLLGVK